MSYKEEFISLFNKYIKRDGASELLKSLEKSDFFTAPASTRFHECYEGGLCEHSVKVFKSLLYDLEYPDENSSQMETFAIVSLLHDLCKIGFYTVEMRNTKDETGKWIKVPFYKVDDKFPYGHSEKSVYMIRDFMKLTPDEAMAINAHMGGFDERKNVISGTFAQCPLAVRLHVADLKATYLK